MKPRFINGCAKSISLVKEFEAMGWDAWTCDLQPSEGWHKHIQDDILKHLDGLTCYKCGGNGYIQYPCYVSGVRCDHDTVVDCPDCGGRGVLPWGFGIFHTDCTYTANSGVRWRVERAEWKEIKDACDFFNAVDSGANFAHVMENPIQHKYAREYIRIYDQIIQPWNFGVLESKAICLWLNGVSELVLPITKKPEGVKQSVWREAPSIYRKQNRARNFPAISKAMAEQWGTLIETADYDNCPLPDCEYERVKC